MEAEAKKHFYEVTTDIGRAMAALRRYRGLSPEQAAAQMGITDKKLAAIERGVLTQNMNNICNLVESLGGRLAIVPEESSADPHCQFIEFE